MTNRITLSTDQKALLPLAARPEGCPGNGTAASSLVRKGMVVRTNTRLFATDAGREWLAGYKPRK